MQIIVTLGKNKDYPENEPWTPGKNCGTFIIRQPDGLYDEAVLKALKSFTGKKKADSLWKNYSDFNTISFAEYLRTIEKFFCIVQTLNTSPELDQKLPYLSTALTAEKTGLSRQRIQQLFAEIPGAYKMPDSNKTLLIPNPAGVDWIKNRVPKKPGPKSD